MAFLLVCTLKNQRSYANSKQSDFGNSWPKADGLVWGAWRAKADVERAVNSLLFPSAKFKLANFHLLIVEL